MKPRVDVEQAARDLINNLLGLSESKREPNLAINDIVAIQKLQKIKVEDTTLLNHAYLLATRVTNLDACARVCALLRHVGAENYEAENNLQGERRVKCDELLAVYRQLKEIEGPTKETTAIKSTGAFKNETVAMLMHDEKDDVKALSILKVINADKLNDKFLYAAGDGDIRLCMLLILAGAKNAMAYDILDKNHELKLIHLIIKLKNFSENTNIKEYINSLILALTQIHQLLPSEITKLIKQIRLGIKKYSDIVDNNAPLKDVLNEILVTLKQIKPSIPWGDEKLVDQESRLVSRKDPVYTALVNFVLNGGGYYPRETGGTVTDQDMLDLFRDKEIKEKLLDKNIIYKVNAFRMFFNLNDRWNNFSNTLHYLLFDDPFYTFTAAGCIKWIDSYCAHDIRKFLFSHTHVKKFFLENILTESELIEAAKIRYPGCDLSISLMFFLLDNPRLKHLCSEKFLDGKQPTLLFESPSRLFVPTSIPEVDDFKNDIIQLISLPQTRDPTPARIIFSDKVTRVFPTPEEKYDRGLLHLQVRPRSPNNDQYVRLKFWDVHPRMKSNYHSLFGNYYVGLQRLHDLGQIYFHSLSWKGIGQTEESIHTHADIGAITTYKYQRDEEGTLIVLRTPKGIRAGIELALQLNYIQGKLRTWLYHYVAQLCHPIEANQASLMIACLRAVNGNPEMFDSNILTQITDFIDDQPPKSAKKKLNTELFQETGVFKELVTDQIIPDRALEERYLAPLRIYANRWTFFSSNAQQVQQVARDILQSIDGLEVKSKKMISFLVQSKLNKAKEDGRQIAETGDLMRMLTPLIR